MWINVEMVNKYTKKYIQNDKKDRNGIQIIDNMHKKQYNYK